MIMKKSCFTILAIVSCAVSIFAHAEISDDRCEQNWHHLLIGPEFFHLRCDNEKNVGAVSYELRVRYQFAGLRLDYNYLKPDSVYFGGHLLITDGWGQSKIIGHYGTHTRQDVYKGSMIFTNCEYRIGYNLDISPRWSITPFAGLGSYLTIFDDKQTSWDGHSYLALGARIRAELYPCLTLGCNLKPMYVLHGEQRAKVAEGSVWKIDEYNNVWGYEISLPLTYFLCSKKWSIHFEPYFLKLNVKDYEKTYGARLQFGYSF